MCKPALCLGDIRGTDTNPTFGSRFRGRRSYHPLVPPAEPTTYSLGYSAFGAFLLTSLPNGSNLCFVNDGNLCFVALHPPLGLVWVLHVLERQRNMDGPLF